MGTNRDIKALYKSTAKISCGPDAYLVVSMRCPVINADNFLLAALLRIAHQ
jgi:hypothetical protein